MRFKATLKIRVKLFNHNKKAFKRKVVSKTILIKNCSKAKNFTRTIWFRTKDLSLTYQILKSKNNWTSMKGNYKKMIP